MLRFKIVAFVFRLRGENAVNRRSVRAVSAISILGLAVIPDSVVGQPRTTVTPEVRQALVPSGKLRVGVYPNSPFSMVRDPVSGEMKGIAVELGKALAMRLDVPYEQVEFRRPAEIYEALKAGRST